MPTPILIKVQLAPERYERCKDCPLCGLIPKDERKGGFKYVCLGTMYTISNEDFEGKTKSRNCDNRWGIFMQLPKRRYGIIDKLYQKFRLPFEQEK